MLVKNFMTPNPVVVKPEDGVKFTFNLLKRNRFRQAPVVKDGKLLGMVTDRDLRGAIAEENHVVVADVMSSSPVTISEDATVEGAAKIIRNCKFNALPVVSRKDELVGIISVTDIIDGLLKLLGFHHDPVRVQVKIPEGIDIYEVLKVLKVCSERVVSFSSSGESYDTFYFWLIGCDFDKLDRKLKEKKLNIKVSYPADSKYD
jgi:CBS domain-containing protein